MKKLACVVFGLSYLAAALSEPARADVEHLCSTPPAVTTAVTPEFPDVAMKFGYSDIIAVDVFVAADGSVVRATLQPGVRELFDLAALAGPGLQEPPRTGHELLS